MGMMSRGRKPDKMQETLSGLFEIINKKQKDDGINDV